MSLLAISVQFYAEPKIVSYVSKNAFWPKPKVDSAIIKLKTTNYKLKTDAALFFRVLRAGFSQPRKQLLNNLSNGLDLPKEEIKDWLKDNGINPIKRGQDLSLDDWINLARKFPRA